MDFGNAAYQLIEFCLNLLPTSPFDFLKDLSNSPVHEWLRYLNWFIPINTFVAIMETWCAAILIYYVIQIALRWANAIE